MRTIIIDDEKPARENLKTTLRMNFPELVLVGEEESVTGAVALLERVKTDLLFLDIDLFDGTGFNILEKLKNIDFQVIFVTAYNDYAIRAFRINALDYILKPINLADLSEAIARAHKANRENSVDDLQKIMNEFKTNSNGQRLAIGEKDGIRYVDIESIIHCKADNSYTDFFLTNNERITASRSLKEYEDILKDFGFFRLHQSYLVQLKLIKKFIREDGYFVEMANGDILPVSRRKKEGLIQRMEQLEV